MGGTQGDMCKKYCGRLGDLCKEYFGRLGDMCKEYCGRPVSKHILRGIGARVSFVLLRVYILRGVSTEHLAWLLNDHIKWK